MLHFVFVCGKVVIIRQYASFVGHNDEDNTRVKWRLEQRRPPDRDQSCLWTFEGQWGELLVWFWADLVYSTHHRRRAVLPCPLGLPCTHTTEEEACPLGLHCTHTTEGRPVLACPLGLPCTHTTATWDPDTCPPALFPLNKGASKVVFSWMQHHMLSGWPALRSVLHTLQIPFMFTYPNTYTVTHACTDTHTPKKYLPYMFFRFASVKLNETTQHWYKRQHKMKDLTRTN